jgi:transposase
MPSQPNSPTVSRLYRFGSDREAGSRFAERLLTVVATGQQQVRSLVDFLVTAGKAAIQDTATPSLLPARPG